MRDLTPLYSAVVLAVACAQAQAITLTEAIQNTLDHHPEIQASKNERLSAGEELNVAKGGYLPTVDVVATYGRQKTDSPSTRALYGHDSQILNYTQSELRLRQLLFDGFNTPNEVGRTQAVVNSRAYYVQGTSQSLALRAIEVYLDVLKCRELLTLARNNLQAHLRINDQITLRSERGVGSAADREQSLARRALAQNNFHTAQVELADAEASFASAVGRLPDELETPPSIKGEVPLSLSDAQQSMLLNNPYLKSAQADVQAAEKQYESSKAPFYPRFDAELAVGANDNLQGEEGHDKEWRAAVVMNYNLFNGNRDKSRLRSNAYKTGQALDIRNNALRMLNENMSLAWNAMDNARLQTPIARDYVTSTTRVRAAYQDQFGLGQRTLLDLLDSENELYNASRRYTEVRYTEELAMYRVLASEGELLRKQRVVLPAEAVALNEVENQARLPSLK
ncbi:TolC family outer membrane protein [Pseudomonas cichorii]|uniref:TolC family outer membrane protein n=1 Tax=Pseudomonas lijiangensis TaxID=2995658 RepID=A0ABX8HNR2_9PSED|nr:MULTISPECIES: TolC family outer membrane protein [Pseudomonas syringae group]MBX8489856.1 TolC family outer membrane protein [Pseudomonas cichorii]MBX8499807.1 TolC family outer membrane protein [Pseudomonas lijiangensis]MBX8503940.1 TolC family outer membrane protein [Pseudomonas lijiangensis]MBX8508160.1 TolC family outer membrane protein [Pseudomonas cichorii]MBX8526225.1 TolC family outer membrane protein [Pseudomonas cichorii]